ncbi:LysM peptidoglycan-binding domain-containing protein [Patescibacteria group bacterium]|nr:LysM peptidoglycan-binding domain-containing protein [Patescibacteria group bacterium]
MSTIKQRLRGLFKNLKADTRRSNRKLLLAAVVLFCLTWSLISPLVNIEKIFLPIIAQTQQSQDQENNPVFPQQNFLTANLVSASSLAVLTSQPTNNSLSGDSLSDAEVSAANGTALVANSNPVTFISQEARTGIITYTVQEGDTISSIAAFFGISLNTLLWANNLKETSIIRPGDQLTVPPITGVIHKIKSGDTISSIAKLYQANEKEIIASNYLPADGTIQIGEKIVVPDGRMPAPVYSAPNPVAQNYTTGPGTGKSHVFPYGQCTWYVAQKRYVPWSGNAKNWLANARAYGFQTGSTPQVRAIIVTNESWYGHVAYVESVNGGWITFSEMNHLGWGIKSVRTISVNDWRIRGYIY